jgi:hypothetical protein
VVPAAFISDVQRLSASDSPYTLSCVHICVAIARPRLTGAGVCQHVFTGDVVARSTQRRMQAMKLYAAARRGVVFVVGKG